MSFLTDITSSPTRIHSENATISTSTNSGIEKTIREFESTFLGLLIKEMRQTLEPEGGLFPGDAGDVQGGLFDHYLSQHLADAGGFGLASVLVKQHYRGTHVAATDPSSGTHPAPAGIPSSGGRISPGK